MFPSQSSQNMLFLLYLSGIFTSILVSVLQESFCESWEYCYFFNLRFPPYFQEENKQNIFRILMSSIRCKYDLTHLRKISWRNGWLEIDLASRRGLCVHTKPPLGIRNFSCTRNSYCSDKNEAPPVFCKPKYCYHFLQKWFILQEIMSTVGF